MRQRKMKKLLLLFVEHEKNSLSFLHKVAKGGSVKSYGIEAARLAGVPKEVIQKAKKILQGLEEKNFKNIPICFVPIK